MGCGASWRKSPSVTRVLHGDGCASWISLAFDYNAAPFCQSFVEVRVEPAAGRVRMLPWGVHGRLRWIAAGVARLATARGRGPDELVETVVPIRAPGADVSATMTDQRDPGPRRRRWATSLPSSSAATDGCGAGATKPHGDIHGAQQRQAVGVLSTPAREEVIGAECDEVDSARPHRVGQKMLSLGP